MSELNNSVNRVLENYYPPYKDFWGPASNLSLGTGLVYSKITHPLLSIESKLFDTVRGPVLVLTHECDISQENERYLNEELLICPIIPFENFFEEYVSNISIESLNNSFLPSLASHSISRAMYLPTAGHNFLPFGGLIYFNQICSTHLSMFEDSKPECSITALGLNRLSQKLQNHLLRPKSQNLPLTYLHNPPHSVQ